MRLARALPLVLLTLSGCAMRATAEPASSAAPTSAYAPSPTSGASREAVSSSALRSSGAGGGTLSVFSVSPMASVPGGAPATPPLVVEDPAAQRDARISQWEREIERQGAALGASLAQCREVCMASSNVCTAAFEICRLTGDLAHAIARDARCGRARAACVDAGRRRDGACPVCPAR